MITKLFYSVVLSFSISSLIAQDKAVMFDEKGSYLSQIGNRYLKNKKVIAMGEATHGTHEFFTIKSNFFKYLSTRHGFNIFALEANYTECLPLDHYIKTGEGNPEEQLNKMQLWPWKTKEVLALILWMREYNQQHPDDMLTFLGIDSGNGAFLGIPYLEQYFSKVGKELLDDWQVIRARHDSIKTTADRDSSIQMTLGFEKRIRESTLPDKEVVAFTLRTIAQNLEFYFKDQVDVYKVRDRHMAENVMYHLQKNPGNKVFVWAHNAHINKDSLFFATRLEGLNRPDIKAMGYYLKQQLGKQAYIIGFEFNKGSLYVNYYSREQQKRVYELISLEEAPEGSLPGQLAAIKRSTYFLPTSNDSKRWNQLLLSHNYGGGKAEKRSMERINPFKAYDAIIFVDQIKASQPINY